MATKAMTYDGYSRRNRQRIVFRTAEHYLENEERYNDVFARMRRCRAQFEAANKSQKKHMLKKTYTFAVCSVQTAVKFHEAAYDKMWEDNKPARDAEIAIKANNAGPNAKIHHMRETLAKDELWSELADLLDSPTRDAVDRAHKLLLDKAQYVSSAKAPFCLAMLGFEVKCCLDSNCQDVTGAERPSTVVPETYDANVEHAFRDFSETFEGMSKFQMQWIIFAAGREEFEDHDHFYTSLGVPAEKDL